MMKPVLIIGGGLTGLTLAQTLQKRGIPYKVYERDASSDSRAQGYRIRLNRLGIESLNELVPAEIFRRIIREAALWYPGLVRLDPTTGRQQGPVIDLPDGPEMVRAVPLRPRISSRPSIWPTPLRTNACKPACR